MAKPLPNSMPDVPESNGRNVMTVEEFTSLAKKLAAIGLYGEAISLYETAVQLHPDNIALKINLTRLREDKKKADEATIHSLKGEISRQRESDDHAANRHFGLGHLHYRRGDMNKAKGFFEMARRHNPNFFLALLLLGKIEIGRNQTDAAIRELELARDLNPFSEEVHSLLGKLYIDKELPGKALEAFVDALILSGTPEISRHPFYNQNIKQILEVLPASRREGLPEYIRERAKRFLHVAENLERKKRSERPEPAGLAPLQTLFAQRLEAERERSALQKKAFSLRRFEIFTTLSDEELFQVAKYARRTSYPVGKTIVSEGETVMKLFLIEAGKVKVEKETPFGPFPLAEFSRNELFGELNIIDGLGHSANVVASQSTDCFVFDRSDLELLWAQKKSVMFACYTHFWKSLSKNIRTTNELMKRFFSSEIERADPREKDDVKTAQAEEIVVDVDQKIKLLKQHGLSSSEIEVLAALSTEQRFRQGDVIFKEGDPGDKLFVILDGKIRISKQIPGVGEEALAILEKGDFFGEMALVDNASRSADAIAHSEAASVFTIRKSILDQTFQTDPIGSLDFLKILCKILSRRLREINQTIIKWWLMSGGTM